MIPIISSSKTVKSVIQYINAKMEPNEGLDFNTKLLKFNGIWPVRDANGQLSNFDYYFPRISLTLASVYLIGVFPMGIYHSWGDTPFVTEQLVSLFTVIMIVVKVGSFTFQPERFQQLTIKTKSIFYHGKVDTKKEEEINKKTQLIINTLLLLYCLFAAAIIGYTVLLFPYLLYIRDFYVRSWFPFDVYVFPIFELVLLMAAFVTNLLQHVASIDLYLIGLMIQVIGQFKLLRHNLKNIRQLAVDDVGGSEKVKSREYIWNNFKDRDEVVIFKHKFKNGRLNCNHIGMTARYDDSEIGNLENLELAASTSTASSVIQIPLVNEKTNIEVNQKTTTKQSVDIMMTLRMRECIRHHQNICGFVDEIERAYYYILIIQIICNIIPSTCAVIWVTTVQTLDYKAVGFIFLFTVCIIELFLFCLLSNMITTESSKVREAVYDADWFDASESFKRSMRIMMSKANQPIEVRVAGYVPLSMETFQNVMHSTFSYYKTLTSTEK